MNSERPEKKMSISLQSKLSFAIFLVVSAVLVSYGSLNYLRSSQTYRIQALESLTRMQTTFETLVARSSTELFRIADQYPLPKLGKGKNTVLMPPSLLSAIDSVHLIATDGRVLASSSSGVEIGAEEMAVISEGAQTANLSKQPQTSIQCLTHCFQSVFVPVIGADGREYIVNINRGIDVIVEDFFAVSGAHIALYGSDQSDAPADRRNHNTLLYALGDEKIVDDLIARLGEQSSYFGELGDSYYGAHQFQLAGGDKWKVRAVILKEENHIRAGLNAALRDTSVSIGLALIAIITLVILVIRVPMRRLTALSEILPLLPESRFDEASGRLKQVPSSQYSNDEIDNLKTVLAQVIDDLQRLNRNIELHREKLREKLAALTDAKEFNEQLLEGSPMIVVVHDQRGSIVNINRLGRSLAGCVGSKMIGNINDWVYDGNGRNLSTALSGLLERGSSQQFEMPFHADDGGLHEILWIHSALRVNEIDHYLSIGIDQTEQHEAMRSLSWLGQHDHVTGLINRAGFTEAANRTILESADDHRIDLIMMDIDDLSIFNERWSFANGDRLLLELTAHIDAILPEGTLLSRTDSGEFCALLKSPGDELVDCDLQALTRYICEIDGSSEEIHISVVVNQYNPSYSGIDELMSDSTVVMARLKQRSKGHLVFAADDYDDRELRKEKYQMKDQLQRALAENRLILFYQPILDVRNNRISHCECLIRLLDDQGQFVAPYKFLGIAAELGMMSDIDFCVIEMAMSQQQRWASKNVDISVGINLTARTLELPDFEQRMKTLLEQTGANPEKLIFEVVETDGLDNIHSANTLLSNIRELGAKIAFDDFGVGFTSFEYVRELPVDYIKIDQSFIRFIHERDNDRNLVKSMIDMSHNLNKKVVVEGVETVEGLKIVVALGAEYVQGYYIAKPAPLDSLNLNISLPPELIRS